MTKELVKYETIESLANEIGEAKLKFYGAALNQLVAFKSYVGRCIVNASHIEKKYGNDFLGKLAKETGLSETILKDCRSMYEVEELTPAKEQKFIQGFTSEYSSWNDYLNKRLGRKTEKVIGTGECKHCNIHCN